MIVPMMEAIARMMMMKIASFMDVKNFHTWSIKESTRFPSAMGIRPRTIYKFQIFIIHASAGERLPKKNKPERENLPPSPACNAKNPPLLLVAPVAHGRSLLAGVFLVAVLAHLVIGLFELEDLAFRLGLVALLASLFLALLVLVVALLAVLGPAGVRLVVEDDRLLGLLDVLEGHLARGNFRADHQAGREGHCDDDRHERCELLHSGSPPSVLGYNHRLHLAHRSDSRRTQSSSYRLWIS